MSDKEIKNFITTEDDEEEDDEDDKRYIAVPAVKRRARNGILLKQRRQKFCAKWEHTFPWLKPDNVDESIGICTVCDKRLVCKKSHLERHQKSYKHLRGLGFEDVSLDTSSVPHKARSKRTTPEFMECGKQEPEEAEEFEHAIELDEEFSLDDELESLNRRQQEAKQTSARSSDTKPSKASKLNRFKLLKRIDRDRNELNEYYYARRKQQSPTNQTSQSTVRDSFDLFFDSVSASVKTFPAKLAAEVKNRVSQVVSEFELRAICEREGSSIINAGSVDGSTMVVASTTQDLNDVDTDAPSVANVGTAQILYTFHSKLNE